MADAVSVYPLFVRDQFFPPTPSGGGGVTNVDQCHLAVAYDGSTIRMTAWMEREGSISAALSCTIQWYDQNGNLVFSVSASVSDAQNHIFLSRSETLLDNHAYYAVISMTDATGPITTHRGVPTTA